LNTQNAMHSDPPRSRYAQTLWWAILLTMCVTPLLFSSAAKNAFRLPKTLFFESMMLLVAAGMTSSFLLGRARSERIAAHRVGFALAAAAVIWTAIVSMTALQPELASGAPLTAFCYAILFAATIFFARGSIVLPFAALFVPATVNAIITVVQALHLWMPVTLHRVPKGRLAAMGLLGNPDYVGAYLMVPALAAIAAAIAFRQHRRVFLAIALILLAGIFFTQSVTAIGAFMIALMSFAILVPSKRARIVVASILIAVVVAVFAFRPTRERLFHMREFLKSGQLMEFSSYRPPAVMAAVDMFRERPLLGAGPGNYEGRYMRYKLAVDERFPQWIRPMNANFGEAHNDHVQLLAESGLPGYLLYLAALAYVASLSFRTKRANSQRAEFARVFALPAVIGFTVVGLAQFPLYLTVVTSTAIFAAALAHTWSVDEGD
jgi:O-antigen ligase